MSTAEGGGNIVTDGLILCLDVANTKSYISGSTSWYDLSRNQNTSTINGSVGLQGNHLYFPGNSVSNTTNDSVFVAGTASTYCNLTQLTLESWYYPTISGSYQYLFSNSRDVSGGAFPYYDGYELLIRDNTAQFRLKNSSISTNVGMTGSTSIVLNTWNQTVATYDGTQMKIYYNGVSDATPRNVSSGIGVPSSFNTYVGRMGYVGGGSTLYKFQGYIDISRIYNRSLTASEVLQNYNATKSRFGL